MAPTLKRASICIRRTGFPWLSVALSSFPQWVAGAVDSEAAVLNAVLIGLMVLSVAGLELGNALQRWEEWIELTFGLWLAASPWLLGYSHLTAMTAMHVALGAVVAVLACFSFAR